MMKSLSELIGRARSPSGPPRTASRGCGIPTFFCRGFTAALLFTSTVLALTPKELGQVNFEQKIGQQISGDLTFHDSDGTSFRFREHFGRRPILLVLGYYHCPMLCTLINNGLIQALHELPLSVGEAFDIVDLSIDPREAPALAASKKIEYVKAYGRPGADADWHFLVGSEMTIAEIARETGFHFAYDPKSNEYAHPSGVIVLTSSGKISRYFLGVNVDPAELHAAIIAASKDKTGSVIQRFALLCYHYNPITGKYGAMVISILRVSGAATVIGTITFIVLMVGRDRSPRRSPSKAEAGRARRIVN